MIDSSYKLRKTEAVCLILIVMVNKLVLNIPFFIINTVGTGSVINLIYIGIIGFIFTLFLNFLFKRFQNSDIIDISEFLGGKFLKLLIGTIFTIFFFFVAYVTLNDFSNFIKTIYFSNSPLVFILLFFTVGIIVANLFSFKSIIRTICVVVPVSIVSIVFSFLAIYDEFTINKFSPFFGYDLKSTFLYGLSNIFSLYIIVYYYFLMPLLKDSNEFKKITIISYTISWLLLFSTVVSVLTIFPMSINITPLNSLYLLSRKIEFGSFLQRIDAVFILLWLISIFSYLSLCIFMINRIISKLTNIENQNILSYSTSSILFGLVLVPFDMSINYFIEKTIYKYAVIITTFIIAFSILILANLKMKFKKGNL